MRDEGKVARVILAGADEQALMARVYPAFDRSDAFVVADIWTAAARFAPRGDVDLLVARADVAPDPDAALELFARLAGMASVIVLPSNPAWGQRRDDFVALPGVIACLTDPIDWPAAVARLTGRLSPSAPLPRPIEEEAGGPSEGETGGGRDGETHLDQASPSLSIRSSSVTRPTVRVGFYGERGGVGVSTAALAAARALAAEDKRVALFDATGRGDLHVMAGLRPGAGEVTHEGVTFFLTSPAEARVLGFDAVVVDGGRARGCFNAEWHAVSRPLEEGEILNLAGIEREIEKKDKEKAPAPARGSGLKLGDLFSIEVTS